MVEIPTEITLDFAPIGMLIIMELYDWNLLNVFLGLVCALLIGLAVING